MTFEVDPIILSESRNQSFTNNKTSIEDKVFLFPELLHPSLLSNAKPIPSEVFDLAKTLVISDRQKELVLSGLKDIDTLKGVENALQWLLSEEVIITKVMNKGFYASTSALAKEINEIIMAKLPSFLSEDSVLWANTLRTIRRFQFQFSLSNPSSSFLNALVKEKKIEDSFWLLMIELSFHFEESTFIKEVIGRDWLNNYYLSLKSKFEHISGLIFQNKEKLLESDISKDDFNVDRFKENKDIILELIKELSFIFREFEFMKKHAIYNGIVGKFLTAYESLRSLAG